MKIRFISFIICLLFVIPLFSNVSIINGLTHINSGASGDVFSGEVILLNSSDTAQRVSFELNDAILSCGAAVYFSNEETHAHSSKTWFKGEVMDKLLRPQEKYAFRFTITIPKDQNLKGTFWSNLTVNVEQPISEDRLTTNFALESKIRYSVRFLTHVNNFDQINVDFKSIDKKEDDSKKKLSITLVNQGLFLESTRVTMEVYNQEGTKVLEDISPRNMIFPGSCTGFEIDISTLSKGEYNCVLLADSREEYVGTNFSLKL
ncbi:hypothetical protein HCG49_10555 [Arenibacter sp. 6A1]|uniref:hypothetical protein n=1 Tax=Arenibacter sp. 6A1 TaxID=2720391 RepID=UPI0014474980|nr:hypothetical protein [Arenibacter sp. 6A1]NKI27002.1 hypothetical protein [Arenibacter sp. 6A1]